MAKRFYFFFMFLLGLLMLLDSSAFAQVTYVENFDNPLGDWTSRWLYQNTNLENYYVAGGTCDPNYRGNEPNGLWISDNRGCGTLVAVNPVRINFLNNFGDTATSFGLDVGVCASNTTLRIYDRNGALVVTDSLPSSCFNFVNHTYALPNGISAFEFNADGQVEGNTSIDNVTLAFGSTVSGTVSYTGAGTGPISIAAFDGEGCGDGNYTEVWIPGPGPYTLPLEQGAYNICACRDTNNNGSCPDPGEPASGYTGNPVTVITGVPVTGINISLQGQPQRVESVPTMTEWGMIMFITLAGLGSVYHLRRQRKA
jgi:hypothetical protein